MGQIASRVGKVRDAIDALRQRLAVSRPGRRRRFGRRRGRELQQGDLLFVPQPDLDIPLELVERNGVLHRGRGRAHTVEWLYRTPDPGQRTYARGRIEGSGATALCLEHWHRVVACSEVP